MPKPNSESVLSLDLGKRRIGIAGCDPLGITVTRLPPLLRTNFANDFQQIKQQQYQLQYNLVQLQQMLWNIRQQLMTKCLQDVTPPVANTNSLMNIK